MGHAFGKLTALAIRHHVLAGTDAQRLVRRHLAPGEDDLHRASHADDARQAHRAAVDQRHAPAPAEDAEYRVLLGDAQIAPQGELQTARHGMARNRGDHRLAEHQAGDAHRPVALVTNAVVEVLEIRSGAEGTVGATQHGDFRVRIRIEATERFGECLRGGSVDVVQLLRLLHHRRAVLEIPTCAEGAAFAPQHRDRSIGVPVELLKSGDQRIRALRIHRVARLGARMDHRPHPALLLDPHRHGHL